MSELVERYLTARSEFERVHLRDADQILARQEELAALETETRAALDEIARDNARRTRAIDDAIAAYLDEMRAELDAARARIVELETRVQAIAVRGPEDSVLFGDAP